MSHTPSVSIWSYIYLTRTEGVFSLAVKRVDQDPCGVTSVVPKIAMAPVPLSIIAESLIVLRKWKTHVL